MDNQSNPDANLRPPSARLGFLLYRSGLAIARGFERALAPLNMMPVESGLLMTLAYDGPNHVRGLARLLGVGRQTVVNATRRLETAGLVRRMPSPLDSRLVQFSITSKGRRLLIDVENIAEGFDAQLRTITGEENEALIAGALQELLATSFLAYES